MKMQIPMIVCIITSVCGLVLAIKETISKQQIPICNIAEMENHNAGNNRTNPTDGIVF